MNDSKLNNKIYVDYSKTDRLYKYGFGFIRLLLILITLIYLDKEFKIDKLGSSIRIIIYILFAAFGACFNVEILETKIEILSLVLIISLATFDLSFDLNVLYYATKTFLPDFFANKLDRKIWRFLFIISLVSLMIAIFIFKDFAIFQIANLWIIMATGQFLCEIGDKYFDDIYFFRHRYSFEIINIFIWIFIPFGIFANDERKLFYLDIIASISYRAFGFILKVYDLDKRKIKNE